ncbi:7004_t:CDS:2 [Dentiscutata erythropus]|uniref:7004_t:CDS:1 n=1 Tax=Dentiscutata erythropus TaxID=1348616 RepID=A0A9N9CW61_9GLOM|nr:7004_t:CDS:2 [Dentiscutata erythropus]
MSQTIQILTDEMRRQLKLNKEKRKPLTVTCQYDLVGNAYLTEEGAERDLWSYLVTEPVEKEEVEEIRDVFDYYYGEDLKKRNTYQIGNLNTVQDSQL